MPAAAKSALLIEQPVGLGIDRDGDGAFAGAPATDRAALENLSDPPIWENSDELNDKNPPLAANDGDQVLPISMTSGAVA